MYRTSTILKGIRLGLSATVLSVASIYLFSCSKSEDPGTSTIQGEWYLESSVDAGSRGNAVVFQIDGKVYIASGFNGNTTKVFLKDLWVYDASIDTWIRKKDLPALAKARSSAVAFVANGKGYVGLGYDGTTALKDFWSYDPATDEWTAIADFPGNARYGAFAFTIDNKGYVGTGFDGSLTYKDFYQYNDATDTWEPKPAVPKTQRTNAFSFVIDGMGYVGGGSNAGTMVQDMYAYDPTSNSWIEKNDLKDDKADDDTNDKGYASIAREQAVSLIINGKVYVVGGKIGSSVVSENWEYDPTTDTWEKKNSFEGRNRFGAIGFSLNDLGYVGTGYTGTEYIDDKWSYDPTQIDVN
jgi:N-acetylneuraminic acid mutarotase